MVEKFSVERESSSSVECIDLNNPQVYTRFPWLTPIHQAVRCVLDYIYFQARPQWPYPQQLANYPNETLFWYHATQGKCRLASRGLKYFLDRYYPRDFSTTIWGTAEPLPFFPQGHEAAMIHTPTANLNICLSPANYPSLTQAFVSPIEDHLLHTLVKLYGGNHWEQQPYVPEIPGTCHVFDPANHKVSLWLNRFIDRWPQIMQYNAE